MLAIETVADLLWYQLNCTILVDGSNKNAMSKKWKKTTKKETTVIWLILFIIIIFKFLNYCFRLYGFHFLNSLLSSIKPLGFKNRNTLAVIAV